MVTTMHVTKIAMSSGSIVGGGAVSGVVVPVVRFMIAGISERGVSLGRRVGVLKEFGRE